MPYCVYSIGPATGPTPLTVDLNMSGCYSTTGADLDFFMAVVSKTDFMRLGKLRSELSVVSYDDGADTGSQKFADPQYKLRIDRYNSYLSCFRRPGLPL